ncbi:MAG: hypothetical protein IJT45_09410 [Bacteroidales bacterium]|nr:hypothetical protein [Bacteroidales bacterium]
MEEKVMSTYALNINERTNAGKALLNYLVSLGVVEPKPTNEPSGYDETLKAIRDVKAGKGTRYKNFDEFKKRMHAL